MIQYIQELKKYDSADNVNITCDNINRLLDCELCAVDTQVKVVSLTPFLS